MKKLIAILVVFTLIVGAAFAETSFGGGFAVKINTLMGTNENKATDEAEEIHSGIDGAGGDVTFNFNNAEGTTGGRFRVHGGGDQGWWGANTFAFAWWKPLDQLRIQMGLNPDGNWGAGQITGWGFHASAQDVVAICNDSGDMGGTRAFKAARQAGFYGGFSDLGLLMSVYAIEGLEINFALPFAGGGKNDAGGGVGDLKTAPRAGAVFSRFHFNVKYNISGVGQLNVSFVGEGGIDGLAEDNMTWAAGEETFVINMKRSPGTMYASFYVSAIEGLGLDFGVGFGIPYDSETFKVGEKDYNMTTTPDIQLGVGARFTSGDFGIKARFGMFTGGNVNPNMDGYKILVNPTRIGVGIMPYFKLPIMTVYVSAGLGMRSIADRKKPNEVNGEVADYVAGKSNTITEWYINPYIQKSMSNVTFWAGLKIFSDGVWVDLDKDPKQTPDDENGLNDGAPVKWAVPIGFTVGF